MTESLRPLICQRPYNRLRPFFVWQQPEVFGVQGLVESMDHTVKQVDDRARHLMVLQ